MIVSLGYPAPDEPPPVKKQPEGKITYFDTYGCTTRDSSALARVNSQASTPEQFLFEYAVFLLTAARGIPDEPKVYGAIRLLDAISRLMGLYSTTNTVKPDLFLMKAKEKIDTELDTAIRSDEEFMKFIEGLIDQFAIELKKRYVKSAQSRA